MNDILLLNTSITWIFFLLTILDRFVYWIYSTQYREFSALKMKNIFIFKMEYIVVWIVFCSIIFSIILLSKTVKWDGK